MKPFTPTAKQRREIYFEAWSALEGGYEENGLCYLILIEITKRQYSLTDFRELLIQKPNGKPFSTYWWPMNGYGDTFDKESRQNALLKAIEETYKS